jgi:ABC transport system ATP-binding/permease protein
MNLVTLEQVSKQYSERPLFESVDLRINVGDRIGLIGVNGSGKTTLLRMIAGEETADSGQITFGAACVSASCPRSLNSIPRPLFSTSYLTATPPNPAAARL